MMNGASRVDGCLFAAAMAVASLVFVFGAGPDGPPIIHVVVLLIGLLAFIALIRAGTDRSGAGDGQRQLTDLYHDCFA